MLRKYISKKDQIRNAREIYGLGGQRNEGRRTRVGNRQQISLNCHLRAAVFFKFT
jgi:hypothetical protein